MISNSCFCFSLTYNAKFGRIYAGQLDKNKFHSMISSKHADKVGVIVSFDLFIENVDYFSTCKIVQIDSDIFISGMWGYWLKQNYLSCIPGQFQGPTHFVWR